VPDKEADVLACIELGGASGYLLQGASVEQLISNVRAVVGGETLCSPRIASLAFSRISALARRNAEVCAGNLAHLSLRELEVIVLIEGSLSNKEIATRLHIEVQTVKNHVHNILEKLQVDSRREAARYAKERGLAASRQHISPVSSSSQHSLPAVSSETHVR
jgi:DNA-binding NarL/FixJ family response regulator